MDWLTTITHTFFDIPSMLQVFPQLLGVGLVNTLIISIAATVIGVVLGMVVAVMGISPSRWLRIPARIYTDVFRGLPAILTILLIARVSPGSRSRSSDRRPTRSASWRC